MQPTGAKLKNRLQTKRHPLDDNNDKPDSSVILPIEGARETEPVVITPVTPTERSFAYSRDLPQWVNESNLVSYTKYLAMHFGDQLEGHLAEDVPAKGLFALLRRCWESLDLSELATFLQIDKFVNLPTNNETIDNILRECLSALCYTTSITFLTMMQQILSLPLLHVSRVSGHEARPPVERMRILTHPLWKKYLEAVLKYHSKITIPNNAEKVILMNLQKQWPSEDAVRTLMEHLKLRMDYDITSILAMQSKETVDLINITAKLYDFDQETFEDEAFWKLYPKTSHPTMIENVLGLLRGAFTPDTPGSNNDAAKVFTVADHPFNTVWNHGLDYVLPNLYSDHIVDLNNETSRKPGNLRNIFTIEEEKKVNSLITGFEKVLDSSRLASILYGGLIPEQVGQLAVQFYNKEVGGGLAGREPLIMKQFAKDISMMLQLPMPDSYAGNMVDNSILYNTMGGDLSPLGHRGATLFLSQLTGKMPRKDIIKTTTTSSSSSSYIPSQNQKSGLEQAREDYLIRQARYEALAPKVLELQIDVQSHPDFPQFFYELATKYALSYQTVRDTNSEYSTDFLESEATKSIGHFIRHHKHFQALANLLEQGDEDERLATAKLEGAGKAALSRLCVATGFLSESTEELPRKLLTNLGTAAVVAVVAPEEGEEDKDKDKDNPFAAGSYFALNNIDIRPVDDRDFSRRIRDTITEDTKAHLDELLRDFAKLLNVPSLTFVDLTQFVTSNDAGKASAAATPVASEAEKANILKPFTLKGSTTATGEEEIGSDSPIAKAIIKVLWPLFRTNKATQFHRLDDSSFEEITTILQWAYEARLPYIVERKTAEASFTIDRTIYAWLSLEIIRVILSYYVHLEADIDRIPTLGLSSNWTYTEFVAKYLKKLETYESEARGTLEGARDSLDPDVRAAAADARNVLGSIRRTKFLLRSLYTIREGIEVRFFNWTKDPSLVNPKFLWRMAVYMPASSEGRNRLQAYMSIVACLGLNVMPSLRGITNQISWAKKPLPEDLKLSEDDTIADYLEAGSAKDPLLKFLSKDGPGSNFTHNMGTTTLKEVGSKLDELYSAMSKCGDDLLLETSTASKNFIASIDKFTESNSIEKSTLDVGPLVLGYFTKLTDDATAISSLKQVALALASGRTAGVEGAEKEPELTKEGLADWIRSQSMALENLIVPGRLLTQTTHQAIKIVDYFNRHKDLGLSGISTFLQYCPGAPVGIITLLMSTLAIKRSNDRFTRSDMALPAEFRPPVWTNESDYDYSKLPRGGLRSCLLELSLPRTDRIKNAVWGWCLTAVRPTVNATCLAMAYGLLYTGDWMVDKAFGWFKSSHTLPGMFVTLLLYAAFIILIGPYGLLATGRRVKDFEGWLANNLASSGRTLGGKKHDDYGRD